MGRTRQELIRDAAYTAALARDRMEDDGLGFDGAIDYIATCVERIASDIRGRFLQKEPGEYLALRRAAERSVSFS